MQITPKTIATGSGGFIAFIFALMVFFGGYFTVDPGYVGVVTTAKNLNDKVYEEGLHLKVPFIDSAHEISIQQVTHTIQNIDAGTSDLQSVTAAVAINFTIDKNNVTDVYRNFRGDIPTIVNRVLEPSVEESLKATTARYTAEQLISKRQTVREEFVSLLKKKVEPFHIHLNEVSITNFAFSKAFATAVEAKVVAEQEAQAEKNKLEKVKQIAEQNLTNARAQAETIRIQAEAITKQGGAEFVQLEWIKKWNGQQPTMVLGSNATPLINIGK
jgi:regulator of protease activity HflC (stomatin/prohibitin superfamily)